MVTASGSNSDTRVGWTVGAGVEGMISRNSTAKLEYLYLGGGTYIVTPGLIGARVNSDFRDHILGAGINYKFGGPVVAKY